MIKGNPFTQTAILYDYIYAKKPYAKEAGIIHSLIQTYVPECSNILDLGCGTGRYMEQFIQRGYQVVGVDRSKNMIAIAKRRLTGKKRARLMCSNIANLHVSATFDAAVSLFHVLSYQQQNGDVVGFFQTAQKYVKRGGVLLFDCWYGPGVLASPPKINRKTHQTPVGKIVRKAIPIWNKKTHRIDIIQQITLPNTSVIVERHCMRYFFKKEIDAMLSSVGFVLKEWGNLHVPLQPITSPPWACWFLAVKK